MQNEEQKSEQTTEAGMAQNPLLGAFCPIMYKVNVDFTANDKDLEDCSFETEMPVLPNVGSTLGFWVRGTWVLAEVSSIIYEFDEAGKYLLAELSVHD